MRAGLYATALTLLAGCGFLHHGPSDDTADAGPEIDADAATDAAVSLDPDTFFASGERLRAVYEQLGEDVKIFERWRDTQLDTDCAFSRPLQRCRFGVRPRRAEPERRRHRPA